MGKKRKNAGDAKPWCFYCDKEHISEKVLIDHQKAKHFKCEDCGKRLDSVGGLISHVSMVHKSTLTAVPNAKAGREDPKFNVYGMDGIPESFLSENDKAAKRKRVEDEWAPAGSDASALQYGFPMMMPGMFPGMMMPGMPYGYPGVMGMAPRGPYGLMNPMMMGGSATPPLPATGPPMPVPSGEEGLLTPIDGSVIAHSNGGPPLPVAASDVVVGVAPVEPPPPVATAPPVPQ